MCKKTKAGIILLLLILSLVITYIQAAELDSTASQINKKLVLQGRHMVIVTGNGFADDELWLPKKIFEANGGRTAIASTTLNELRGMHQGTTVKAQTLVNDIDIDKLDVLMFVGGRGGVQYLHDEFTHKLVWEAYHKDKIIAAICLAPGILANAGILKHRKATCWDFDQYADDSSQIEDTQADVQCSEWIITAKGPFAAQEFGETVVSVLKTKIDIAESITQNPPVVPRWAFNHWVWEDQKNTQQALEGLVAGYLERNIPVGAVIVDSPWCTTYNDFIWNTKQYPDPQGMIDRFHAKDIMVLVFYTGCINSTSNDAIGDKCHTYDYVKQNGLAINGGRESKWWKGNGMHFDVTQPAACQWWRTQVSKVYDMGVDGAKVDFGYSPFGRTLQTSIGPMPNQIFGYRFFADSFDYAQSRNKDSVTMTYGYVGENTHKEYRRGYLGLPSKSHVNWVGDFRGDWQGIGDQLNNIYKSAQHGFAAPACEIGGYFKPASNRLQFIRYCQFGSVVPVMINGGNFGALEHHLPWNHGDDVVDIYRKFVTLHTELIPYLFSMGVDVHQQGGSIISVCSLEEKHHWLGRDLFIQAITDDNNEVTLHLPAEADWIDYWNSDKIYDAGSTITRTYSIDEYPIFIKAGAIIPLAVTNNILGHGDWKSAGKQTLMIYPSGISKHRYHKPTGQGVDYENIDITVNADTGQIQLEGAIEDTYILRIKSFTEPTTVRGLKDWSYDSKSKVLRLEVTGKKLDINIEDLRGY